MGRYRLHAALFLLVTGLLGLRAGVIAQGAGDRSPYPPPGTSPAGRAVIASTQPVTSTTRPVAAVPDPAAAQAAPTDRPLPPLPELNPTLPQGSSAPGGKLGLPIPDEELPPRGKRPGLPPGTEPIATTPPAERATPLTGRAERLEYRLQPGRPAEAGTPTEPSVPDSSPGPRQVNHVAPAAEPGESAAGGPGPGGAQPANVSLEVVGPASVHRGQPFAYEIVLRNNGSTPARQVQVEETLQPGVRCTKATPQPDIQGGRLLWNVGNLAAGAEQRLHIEVQPPADGEVVSSAHATFMIGSSLRTRVTQPQLSLTQTVPENAQVGDEVMLQLQVTNTGTGPATHVLVRDRLPAGLQHAAGTHVESDVGALEAGEKKTLTLRARAVQPGKQVNEATVTGDDCAAVSTQGVVMATQAALALHDTSPENGLINQDMEYRLEVASAGSAPATNVHLSDILPRGLEFVSASDGGRYADETRTVLWDLGALAPGQVRSVTFRARTRMAGAYVHRATATADRGLEAKAAGSVRTEGVPALTLSVIDRENLVEVNAETTYEIRVVNQGSGPCSNVRIVAAVPDGLTPVSAQGPAANQVSAQQVLFDPVPRLDAGAEILFHVKAKGRKTGDWRFQAQLTSDQLTRAVRKEAGTRVVDP